MTLLERLDSDASTGLDLSPGNNLSREAATEIRRLSAILSAVNEEMDRQMAIRDEKIQQLLDTLAQYTDTTRLA